MQKDRSFAIEIKNLSFSYGPTKALENINLRLKENIFLSIIGPNGGGKTTLFNLMLGLLEPDTGTIKIFSKNPKDARNLIGYVPQINDFNKDLPATALDVVLSALASKKSLMQKIDDADREYARESLKQVGMLEHQNRQISRLSGGQIQRVLIARALVRSPRILLLDEPVSNIDSKTQKSIYSLLKELKKNMTIIMITHDISTTSAYVDEVACLNVKMHHHGDVEGGLKALSKMSSCPVELLAHGVPHRVLGDHHA